MCSAILDVGAYPRMAYSPVPNTRGRDKKGAGASDLKNYKQGDEYRGGGGGCKK